MPVPRGSRFADLPVYQVVGPDGEPRQVLGLGLAAVGEGPRQGVGEDTAETPGSGIHRVTQGEEADLIARRYLGDEQLWWRVLDVNPLRYPLDIAAGDILRLPDLGQATRANRAREF